MRTKIQQYISIILLLISLILFGGCSIINKESFYERDYFEKLGFNHIKTTMEDIDEMYGKPMKEYISDDEKIIWEYQDFKIKYMNAGSKNSPCYKIQVLTIFSDKYTFGRGKIGVGSTKQEVIDAYGDVTKIKEEPVGCGYIDKDRTFVFYSYNSEDIVESIEIIPDGP